MADLNYFSVCKSFLLWTLILSTYAQIQYSHTPHLPTPDDTHKDTWSTAHKYIMLVTTIHLSQKIHKKLRKHQPINVFTLIYLLSNYMSINYPINKMLMFQLVTTKYNPHNPNILQSLEYVYYDSHGSITRNGFEMYRFILLSGTMKDMH